MLHVLSEDMLYRSVKNVKWWHILIPLGLLVALQSWLVWTFGSEALEGASQVALLLTAALAGLMAVFLYGKKWSELEQSMERGVGNITSAMLILLMIGMVSGTWMVSGVIPTLICYGLKIISPKLFLFTACFISGLVAVMTGSSWTTIATIGVAILGIGHALGYEAGMTAGAIISGAYFGDKISPLSDTTVLASSTAGTNLFTHINYMLRTTIPSITLALLGFLVLSLLHPADAAAQAGDIDQVLRETFHISPWLLIVPLLTAVLIALRVPAIPTLLFAALLAAGFAWWQQPQILWHISTGLSLQAYGGGSIGDIHHIAKGTMECFYGTTQIDSGNAMVNELISTRGMRGMLNTIFLIVSAATFGAILIGSGMLDAFTQGLMKHLRRRTSVVGSTVGMGIMSNLMTGDQYVSITLTCSVFRPLYEKLKYENRLLSRSAEDSATVTSVLIPWNSCGMTQAMVLGVPTLVYLPWCFFNWLSPLMSILAAYAYRPAVDTNDL